MEPLEAFFSGYDGFTHDLAAPATREFRRLCQVRGWDRNSNEREEAMSRFRVALIQQFNLTYGTDINNLNGWHAMMTHMGVDPLPETVAECKKIVKRLFVNLVDLVDARGDPTQQVRLFNSEVALSKYTRKSKKIFPRDEAKAGGILKFLLRQIMRPRQRK
ncbi:hypothetical protein P691DRAFT_680939 [Macrolepiota fuliginosa MF-IS2]|uniref:Uncharacterized protein n=1 Tax=Macrolepiota fuliginosa MF-IS2 TaxID=1400762 RepID=A0A9P5X2A4_9AGAR|nr:hypothetical protein P691DRAFT_680939 [Macrolepiota fuliginosa MF-IS2]